MLYRFRRCNNRIKISSIWCNQKSNQLIQKSFIMKKIAVTIVLIFSFSISSLSASTSNQFLADHSIAVADYVVSPLCKAVAVGDIDEVKRLIENGAEVNQKSNGMMPIHYAAKYNRVEIIKVLITAGSEIHTPCDQGYTALRHAQKAKASDAAQFLKRFKKLV